MREPVLANIDEKLSVNKFNIDEGSPHIVLTSDPDDAGFNMLVQCCPAALYKWESDGSASFDYAGCLECGTCRILAMGTVLETWRYPRDAKGIHYRYG